MSVRPADAYHLDLSAPALSSDPYQTYARLRANRGVHYWCARLDESFPVLSRYADVRLALRDARFGPVPPDAPTDRTSATGCVCHASESAPAPPRRDMHAIAVDLLDRLATHGAFDLVAEYACPLSAQVARALHASAAGQEVIVAFLGNAALALLSHRDQLAWLRATPERTSAAVDELLRFDSPVQRTTRLALDDIELPEGDVIEAGEPVSVLIGAANRDYSQFSEADRLDLDRPNANRHLTFASGAHMGADVDLARLEAEVSLGALVQRLPNLHLVEPYPTWRPTFEVRCLEALHVCG